MAALAVKQMSTSNQLPLISNGKLIACREALPNYGVCTSLPPLPCYTVHGIARARWGEDEDIDRLGYAANSGYPRYRNNIDSCHPVSEDPEHFKYEGYMYRKPMHQDLTVLRTSVFNTSRRVPRDCKCELFPRHNASRLYDGQHVLGDGTRRAIEENISRLYRTTRYNTIFNNTSRFMLAKAERDTQYRLQKGPGYVETPTCSRVHNHPDPCAYCWYGGCNKDFERNVAEFQSRLYPPSKSTEADCTKTDICDVTNEVCNCHKDTCSLCRQNESYSETECGIENNEAITKTHQTESYTEYNDTFGPWQNNFDSGDWRDDQSILTNVYQFKLPSSIHCQSTQNEHAFDLKTRHNILNNTQLPLDHSKSLDRTDNVTLLFKKQQESKQHSSETLPKVNQKTDNSWAYRDGNNLRIPCIADVIGSSNKSDAHKRYHWEHPEPIPDLRDHRRYSRRVKFNGFSSSVFR